MRDHLFCSESGALYDTRVPLWSTRPPLRPVFRQGFPSIENTHQLKAALRNGEYAWPGGYQLYFLCSDGAALCFACVRNELRNILPAIRDQAHDGWCVVATTINYEDADLTCDHCGDKIPAAYVDDDPPQEKSP